MQFGALQVSLPRPLNNMASSEVNLGGVDVVDTNQVLRKIRMQVAAQICEQIEGIIMKHLLKTILSKKKDLDEMVAELQFYGVDPASVKDKLNGHPLFEDEDFSNEVRVSSTEPLKASSIREDDTCINKKNELQQVNHEDVTAKVNRPRSLNNVAYSEVAAKICEQIQGIITMKDLDEMVAELQFYGVDPSSVKDKVDSSMTSATQYNAPRLACSQKATLGTCDQRLTHTTSKIAKSIGLRETDFGQRQASNKGWRR
ncbi:hypothetical protein ACLB2K_002325 [Fragaria x ananassa]